MQHLDLLLPVRDARGDVDDEPVVGVDRAFASRDEKAVVPGNAYERRPVVLRLDDHGPSQNGPDGRAGGGVREARLPAREMDGKTIEVAVLVGVRGRPLCPFGVEDDVEGAERPGRKGAGAIDLLDRDGRRGGRGLRCQDQRDDGEQRDVQFAHAFLLGTLSGPNIHLRLTESEMVSS